MMHAQLSAKLLLLHASSLSAGRFAANCSDSRCDRERANLVLASRASHLMVSYVPIAGDLSVADSCRPSGRCSHTTLEHQETHATTAS